LVDRYKNGVDRYIDSEQWYNL